MTSLGDLPTINPTYRSGSLDLDQVKDLPVITETDHFSMYALKASSPSRQMDSGAKG